MPSSVVLGFIFYIIAVIIFILFLGIAFFMTERGSNSRIGFVIGAIVGLILFMIIGVVIHINS